MKSVETANCDHCKAEVSAQSLSTLGHIERLESDGSAADYAICSKCLDAHPSDGYWTEWVLGQTEEGRLYIRRGELMEAADQARYAMNNAFGTFKDTASPEHYLVLTEKAAAFSRATKLLSVVAEAYSMLMQERWTEEDAKDKGKVISK